MKPGATLSEIGLWLREVARFELFPIAGTSVTVMTLVVFALVVVAAFWISRLTQRAIGRVLRARGVGDEGTIGVTSRLLHYGIMALGLGVALQTVGINLTALFAAGAFFAVAFGFAMQNITENFVSGLILLVERTIKPGDVLDVEGRMVRVSQLGTRATVVRSLDEEDLIVPNGVLVQGTVKNFTLRDAAFRTRVVVGVSYDSDMHRVRAALKRAAEGVAKPGLKRPVIFMLAFGSSSVDWEVSIWVDDPWKVSSVRSDLHESIWWALKEDAITIAYPQLDLHVIPRPEAPAAGEPG